MHTDGLAGPFLAVAISVVLSGWIGFTLAELGWFSPWGIALLDLAAAAVAHWLAGERLGPVLTARRWLNDWSTALAARVRPGRRRPPAPVPSRDERINRLVLAILLGIGAVLFARPAEMLRGALDAGVYVNSGIALARTGAIIQHDQLMRELLDINPAPPHEERQEGAELLQPQSLQRWSLDRLRMPGFFVLEKKTGSVLPQHYNLYPVWIGIFYGLFGLYGALYATPFLALLACAAVFFFARQAFGVRAAQVGLAFLATCPLQIWFARYHISEVPTELIAFLFLYLFLRFHEKIGRLAALEVAAAREDHLAGSAESELVVVRHNARLYALLAGVTLGQISFLRPEFPFYVIPLVGYLLWWRLSRTWRPEHTWLVAPLVLVLAQWSVHFFFFSFAYTMDTYHNKLLELRSSWGRLLPLLYGAIIALVLADRQQHRLRPLAALIGGGLARRRAWLLGGISLAVGAFLAYRYLWQPRLLFRPGVLDSLLRGEIPFAWQSYIGAPLEAVDQTGKSNQPGLINTNSYILVRVGWYLSPLGMLLGAAGLLRALWKRLHPGTTYFFALLVIFGVLFSDETYTVATYPYSLRRFLPVVIPGVLILGAYALAWIGERWRPRQLLRPLAWATAGALVVFFLATGWTIITHTEEAGAVAAFQALAARFKNPAKTVLLFSNERDEPYVVATPLQYTFGFNAFSLNRPYGRTDGAVVQGIVQRWMRQGYEVYAVLGANGGKLFMPDLALAPYTDGGPPTWSYSVTELEQLFTQKPKNISPVNLPWGLYRIVPRAGAPPPPLPYRLDIGGFDYDALLAGFAVQEQQPGDATPWRWAYRDAYLRLPWPAAARTHGATLTLRLSAGPTDRPQPAQVQVLAGKVCLQLAGPLPPADPCKAPPVTLAPGAPFQDLTFAVPLDAPPDPANPQYLVLHLIATTWSPAATGVSVDGRNLGVRVDSLSLEVAP